LGGSPLVRQKYQDENSVRGDNEMMTMMMINKERSLEHVPKSLETSKEGKMTILWNQQLQTHRTIPDNKPNIIVHDNKK
jgi:hypothetical protein